jgi:uncharacterized membrane protein YhiD involved in acid resistance
MWMAGALGVACGAGYYVLAIISTLLTVVILTVLNRIELGGTRGVMPELEAGRQAESPLRKPDQG